MRKEHWCSHLASNMMHFSPITANVDGLAHKFPWSSTFCVLSGSESSVGSCGGSAMAIKGWNGCFLSGTVHRVYIAGRRNVGSESHGKTLCNAVLPTRLLPWSGGRVLKTCRMIYLGESFITSPAFPNLRIEFEVSV